MFQAPTCPEIHGHDCLGDFVPALPESTRPVSPQNAVTLILDTLRKSEEKIIIVALAPLTNIAVAMRLEPELFRQKVKRIFWMGGGIALGNYTAVAEANAAFDPEAAHIVLSSNVPVTMYTWDAYVKIALSREELSKMGILDCNSGEVKKAFDPLDDDQRLCSRIMHREMRLWDQDFAMMGDAIVILLLQADTSLYITKSYNVQVELAGKQARGMTIVDRRENVDHPDIPKMEPNTDVVVGFDVGKLKHQFSRILYGEERATKLSWPDKWVSF